METDLEHEDKLGGLGRRIASGVGRETREVKHTMEPHRLKSAGSDRADALMGRVRSEYREMPGLCLTVPQASRLWQIDPSNCERVLHALAAEGFLARTPAGAFVLGSRRARFDIGSE
jgi:hypothetical protein